MGSDYLFSNQIRAALFLQLILQNLRYIGFTPDHHVYTLSLALPDYPKTCLGFLVLFLLGGKLCLGKSMNGVYNHLSVNYLKCNQ